jgi:hypothetical protein
MAINVRDANIKGMYGVTELAARGVPIAVYVRGARLSARTARSYFQPKAYPWRPTCEA